MTIPPKVRIAALLLLALAVVALYVSIRHAATVARLVELVTQAQDEALGPNWHKVRIAREVAATVPGLREELARAKAAGTKPLATVIVKSGDTVFEMPGVCPAELEAPKPTVACEAQGALTGLADGSIRQTWAMWGTLTRGDWTERRRLDNVMAELTIDPAIAKAWATANAPPAYRIDVLVGASFGTDGPGLAATVAGGRGWLGWYAGGDYVFPNAGASRVQGGVRITPKR